MGLFDSAPDARKDSASLEKPSTGLFDSAPPLTRAEPSFLGAAARGFKRSLPETKSLLVGSGALLAQYAGAEGTRDALLSAYQDIEKQQVEPLAPRTGFIDAVTGDGSLKEWAGDTLGNFAGQALQSVAAAGAGALIGTTVPGVGNAAGAVGGLVARGAVKEGVEKGVQALVRQQIEKGVAREAAEAAGDAARRKALQRLGGGVAAPAALNVGQETGIAFTDRAADAQAAGVPLTNEDATRALGYGTAAGLLDTAAEVFAAGRALKGASEAPGMLRRVATGAAQGATAEGATEGAQAVLERAGAARDVTGTEAYRDYIENIAAGALGGGVMGGASGVRRPDIAAPPPGPLTRAAATITGAPAAPAPTAPPAQIAPAAPAAPSAPSAPAEPAPAAQIPDAAVQVLSTAAKAGKAIGPQALAKAIGVDEAAATDMLRDFEARGLVSPPNKKGTRRVLLDPATGVLVDAEAAKADQRAAKKQAKAGAPAQAIAATQEAQAGAPMFGPEAEARMAEKRATALSRLSRPNPAAGPASAAGAVAFDTGAADVAAQAAAQQDQQQAVAAQQQAESEQQRAIQQQEREALRLQKQAQQRQSMALQQQKMDAQTYDEEDVRAVIESMLDQGQRIDALRLGKQMGVKPRVVDNIRRAVFQERSQSRAPQAAGQEVIDAEFTDVTQPGASRALPPPDQRPGQIKAVQQADAQVRQMSAGMPPPQDPAAPASPAQATVAPDDTPEVLDDDITLPSGEPFTIRGAAELAAKRNPGARVVEVDGGFVVRPVASANLESSRKDAQTNVVVAPAGGERLDKAVPGAPQPRVSQDDKSFNEWADNYARVTAADDIKQVSTTDLNRAINYADRVASSIERKAWEEGKKPPADAAMLRREIEVLRFEWDQRADRFGASAPQTAAGATQAKPDQTQQEPANAEQTPRAQQAPATGQAAEAAGEEGKALLSEKPAAEAQPKPPTSPAATIRAEAAGVPPGLATTFNKMADAIEAKNAGVLGDILSYAENKRSRDLFTKATGVKLPRTVSGSQAAINEWLAGQNPAAAPGAKPSSPTVKPSTNTIFTEDAAAAARARLKSKFNRLGSLPLDPEMMLDGITLAGYHIERGARSFTAYAKAMIGDLGDVVRPYLKSWYSAVRMDPRAAGFDGMDSLAEVETAELPPVDATPDLAQDGITEEGANGTPESDGAPALDTAPAGKGRGAQEAGATGSSADSGSPPRVGTDSGADGAGVSGPRGGRGGKGRVPAAETGAAAGGRLGGPRAGRARKGVPGADAAVTLPAEAVASTEPTNVPAINFKIDADLELGKGGEVGKFNDNVAAIRTLKQIEAERRRATPEEQRILARWVGWGGLASAFPNPETGKFKDGWEKRGNELRELLTPSEYQAARRSTRNAHFTSETVVGFMWDAVRKLGYRGGLALESSMGSGNFLGLMPDDIGPTKFIGVEYDSITARLAAALYPQATVLHSGFQSVPLPNDSFDLSIGNPPFGNESLRFQYKPELRGLSIHNQFFLAAMDALKPGGLQVQVVSNFLLDAQDSQARRMLADRADLVAAFRLPDTAFKENARTEVVTDILILRKREYRLSEMAKDKDGKPTEPSWPEWVSTGTAPDPLGGDPIPLNNYFIQNPDHIIGTLERSGKMRAAGMPNVRLEDPSTLGARLQDMLGRLRPLGRLTETTAERTERAHKLLSEAMGIAVANQEPGHMAFDAAGGLVRVIEREHGDETIMQRQPITADSPWSPQLFVDAEGRWYKVDVKLGEDGKPLKQTDSSGAPTRFNAYTRTVYATEAEVPSTLRLGKTGYERLKGMVALRDLLKQQLVLETEDATAQMEPHRKKLAAAYRAYVAEHGPVNRRANAALLSQMPDGALVLALESSYEPERTAEQAKRSGLPKQAESVKPAPILSERVVPKYEPATKAETPADALAITLAESGRVDMERIAALLGQDLEQAADALTGGDKPLVFKDPESNTYETADAYLSGQVVRKLQAARAAGLEQNIKALQAIQPEPWGAENVSVQMGATWVPADVYATFAQQLLGAASTHASFAPVTNTFSLTVKGVSPARSQQWNVEFTNKEGRRFYMSAVELLQSLLNSKTPVMGWTDQEGRFHVDKDATTVAIYKGRELATEFGDWIFKDSERRARLVGIFNERYNTRVTRQYDGQHLTLPGKVPDTIIKMRRHQKNAIWRGISSRFLLIDHVVGAGKTFTAIARAMERRRMGLARKPTIVVPNHLVEQWQADIYRLYPGAKVLAATKADFEMKRRRRLLGRVATGDYDIVVLPHSSFGFIGIAPETELRYLEEDLAKAVQAVKDAEADAEEEGQGAGNRRFKPMGVKEAERLVAAIENRMGKLREGVRDRLLTFEQLGIDDLTIDEAHEFKNLFYSSRLTKVRGMGDKQGSRKAADLYNKVRLLRDSNGSVVFMTGTPVSNSVVELYSMMRYLASNELAELGMEHFDAWRAQFVDAAPAFEPNEAGQLKEVTRLGRSWSNMRSLMDLYYSFTDAVTIEDIKTWYAEDNAGARFPVPVVKGGDRQLVKMNPTPAQEEMLSDVLAGFNSLDSIQDIKVRNATRLRLMDRARKLSLDARAVDPTIQSKEEGGKLEKVSKEVKRIYDQWSEDRGTQLIFLDRSVPKAKGDDKVIKAYDALVKKRDAAALAGDDEAFQDADELLEAYDANEIEAMRSAQAGGWNAYQQIKDNLVAMGIPAEEIRFVQEANTDEQKQALFDAVNGGKVRVLIGSTPRMGAGTNVQKRLVGLHHVDVTWKPSDIEQREGRIVRFGNDLLAKYGDKFEVEILAYATERTVDAKMWSLNATKLKAINGLRKYTGDFTMEVDDEESVSMAEMAALASGNPLLLERVTLEAQLNYLELQEKSHRRQLWGLSDALDRAQRIVDTYPAAIEDAKAQQQRLATEVDALVERAKARRVTVEGEVFDKEPAALKAALDSIQRQQAGNENARYAVTINGVRLTNRKSIDEAIGSALGDASAFEAEVGGSTYTERTAAGRAVADALSPKVEAAFDTTASGTIGQMLGMPLHYEIRKAVDTATRKTVAIELWLEDEQGRTVASVEAADNQVGIVLPTARMRDLMGALASEVAFKASPTRVADLQRTLERSKRDVADIGPKVNAPFPKAAELEAKRARLGEVIAQLTAAPPLPTVQSASPVVPDVPASPAPARAYFRSVDHGELRYEPKAKPVSFDWDAASDLEFFIAPGFRAGYEVIETTTGLKVGDGTTQKAAKDNALRNMQALGKDKLLAVIKERRIDPEKLAAAQAQQQEGRHTFAKSGEAPGASSQVLAAWRRMAADEGLFQFKKSAHTKIEPLLKEIAPEITVQLNDGDRGNVLLRVPATVVDGKPKGPDATAIININPESGQVYIDVDDLKEGVHRGSAIYAAALNYAFNNNMVFVPDPEGVKLPAMIRRTEHMLSSALKFGTTRHMLPHPEQGLDWRPGDDAHNLLALLEASADNVFSKVPDLDGFDYDWDAGQFVGASGSPVTGDDFRALANAPAARAAKAGPSTLRRALVQRSLARRAGTSKWSGVARSLLRLGRTGLRGLNLAGIAYGRDAANKGTDPARLRAMLKGPAARLKDAHGIDLQVLDSAEQLPQSIRDQDDYDDTVQAVITGDRRTVYLIANRIRSPQAALKLAAHELVGHFAMEEMLGARLFGELQQRIKALADAGKWPEVFAEVRRRYERNADGTFRALDDATFAAEAIAVFAEKNIQTSILQRAINAVRGFLRRIFPQLELSQGELRQMLWEAGQYLEGRAYRPEVAARALGEKPAPAQKAESLQDTMERFAFGRTNERDTFYSALLRAIEEGKGLPKAAGATQWKQWLDGAQRRGEIKQSERDWIGLDAWLDGQQGNVTREALAEYVRANRVQVQEVVLSDRNERPDSLPAHLELAQDAGGYWRAVYADGPNKGKSVVRAMQTPGEVLDEYYRTHPHQDVPEGQRTKYAGYRVPGGDNYREMLLTLPAKGVPAELAADVLAAGKRARDAMARLDEVRDTDGEASARQEVASANAAYEALKRKGIAADQRYKSSHWDQPNVLAHVRFDEREVDGKRVLYVQEIQSDWHQAGRKNGYGDGAQRRQAIKQRMAELAEQIDDGLPEDVLEQSAEYERLADELRGTPSGGVPDAPLKQTDEWAMLAFKRMARWAVDNGFDTIAWTTGEQAAEVFDLSKQVDSIDWLKNSRGYAIAADKGGRTVIEKSGMSEDDLASTVGKEVAEKIVSSGKDFGKLSGLDLKVGGEGMRGFYDKILPAAVGKWAKKFGAKVGATDIKTTDMPWSEYEKYAVDHPYRMKNAPRVHSIDITPQMRAAVAEGQPLFAKGAEPSMLDRLQDAINPDDTTLLQRIKDKWADWRPAALGALTLRHLGELAKGTLPAVSYYSDLVQRMASMRNELQESGHEIMQKGLSYLKANRDEAPKLFELLHDATIAGVDPAEAYRPLKMPLHDDRTLVDVTKESVRKFIKELEAQMRLQPGSAPRYGARIKEVKKLWKQERERAAAYPAMKARWNALSTPAKDQWVAMRDAYIRQSEAYEQALLDRIQALDMAGGQKAAMGAKMRAQFEAARVPFYVPLARWGEYWVSGYTADGERVFLMTETQAEQRRAREQMKAEGVTGGYMLLQDGEPLRNKDGTARIFGSASLAQGWAQKNPEKAAGAELRLLDVAAGVKLDKMRQQDGASGAFMVELQKTLKQTGAPDSVLDEVYQLYLRTLPDLSIRKNFIHRKKTAGYSQDALRAFAGHVFHGSFQISRLAYGYQLEGALRSAEGMTRNMATDGDERANAAGRIVNELKRRHEWVMNPQDSKLVNKLSGLGFVWYLGITPGAALVNLLQTPMVTLPVLAAKYGANKATAALLRASKEAMGTYGHIEKKLSPDELEAYNELRRRGAIDKTQVHNLAGVSESDTHAYNPFWHQVMTVIGHLFHKAEVINREASGMAAYRLARDAGKDKIAAIKEAEDAIWESHFDYSNANRARFMQSGAAKVLLMFRQFALNMTWFLCRNAWNAFKGATPEQKTQARRKLAGVLGMHAVFAGTLGLPLMSVTFGVLNAVAGAFGDDDEPWDAETEFRTFLRETLGDGAAEAVLRGPVQAATGVNISQRVSLNDLWFRDADRELEGRAWANYLFEQAAGPLGGIVTNYARGRQLMDEGHLWRGIETMMPKAVKDGMKAVRFQTEGVNTLRGDPVIEDFGVLETIGQLTGLAPARVAEQFDVNRDLTGYADHILNRRRALMDAFAMAVRMDDADTRAEVLRRMIAFSRKYPELAITGDSLRRSLVQRARYSAQAQGGVVIDRRLRERLGMEQAGT